MHQSSKRRLWLATAASFAALTVGGQAAAADQAGEVDTLIVTGTRVTGLRAVDSAAPIQVLGTEALQRVGQPDLNQALAQNVPSFTAQATGGDTSNMTLAAKLRGVSPNHALVLINGKRRHGTANLSIAGGSFAGGAGADLNFVPVASISHIEVLQDGAAAQYGSDAIAGVINIILKKATQGGVLSMTGGEYFDGGGVTGSATGNIGFAPIEGAYLNLTGEWKYHGFSFRGDKDPRTIDTPFNVGQTNSPARSYPNITQAPGYPFLNLIPGDAQYHLYSFSYNAGYDLGDDMEVYTFGSYGRKIAQSHQNFRLPNVVVSATGVRLYPLGFDPRQELREHDFQATLGLKGVAHDWNWDFATSFGKDFVIINVKNTGNADFYRDFGTTPTYIMAGKFQAGQWTNTLDLTREFDVGLAGPLNVAVGGEYREDYYSLKQGDLAGYYKGGSQSYFGFSPKDASSNERSSYAGYVDLAFEPVEGWTVDAAGRYGHFSDFGDTTVFKLTSRYDFSDMFALRGTASTGFRAPTLAEGFYSGINVGPSSISGVLAPNSAGAKLLGIDGLDAEKSTNFSVGFVAHPIPRMTVTLDAYQIKIRDRIVRSGTLLGDASNKALILSPNVLKALEVNGVTPDSTIRSNPSWTIGVSLFSNGLDTRTRGLDFVITYSSDFGDMGRVDWSLNANYNETKIVKIAAPPSGLAPGVALFTPDALAQIETNQPKYKAVLGAVWTLDKLTVALKESFYGKSKSLNQDTFGTPVYRETVIKPAAITDIEVSYQVLESVRVAIGANNVFNTYPDRINGEYRQHLLQQNSNGFVTQFPGHSPFGINGGYYYGRVAYTF